MAKLGPSLLVRVIFGIGRAIFTKDLPCVALHLIHALCPDSWGVNEWNLFTGKLTSTAKCPSSFPEWSAPDRKADFAALVEHCPNMIRNVDLDSSDWVDFGRSDNCTRFFPRSRLSAVERLLLVQALRPDNLTSAINDFCCSELGIESLSSQGTDLNQLWRGVRSKSSPILLVTAHGIDPGKELEELASRIVGSDR